MSSAKIIKNEELLLTALSAETELYGLQILNLIEQASDGEIIINYASLYPLLNKLEKKGYIKSRWEEKNQRKGPRRRYYKITPEGTDLVNQCESLRTTLKKLAKNSNNPDGKKFSFEVVTVNRRGEIIHREQKQAQYFTEDLGNGVTLDMVEIPGGTFIMGSPEGEGYGNEKPQHKVTVPSFFMGKFPVTQAQWKQIASLPKVKRDLKTNPSEFKGDERPVEKVSWYDAVEFCQRLSRQAAKEYRLPSEAEWEYACRAVISDQLSVTSGDLTVEKWNEKYNQPFHFGETITSELANYNASQTYAQEAKGEYTKQTTPVGQFPPNAFGLYDMHGNIWEWCADNWHDNYEGAPTDGSAWTQGGDDNLSPLRGGSWDDNPLLCRSAYRILNVGERDSIIDYFSLGFRVVLGDGRTP